MALDNGNFGLTSKTSMNQIEDLKRRLLPDLKEIVDEVQGTGFVLEAIVDLVQCQYEYQYLYVITKPN